MTKNSNEYMRKYRQENREKCNEYQRRYYLKHKKEIYKHRKETRYYIAYHLKHKEKLLRNNRIWRSSIKNERSFYCLFCKREYSWFYKNCHLKTKKHILAKMIYEHIKN